MPCANLIRSKKDNQGFTLIEILLVIAIIGLLAGFTAVAGSDFYRGYAFRSERDIIVATLQKARSQTLSNVNQTGHGVHVGTDGYTLFEGSRFNPADSHNLLIPKQSSVTNNGPLDIIFTQLTAGTASTTILLTDGFVHTAAIRVTPEGRINW